MDKLTDNDKIILEEIKKIHLEQYELIDNNGEIDDQYDYEILERKKDKLYYKLKSNKAIAIFQELECWDCINDFKIK